MGDATRGQDVNLDIFRTGQPVLILQPKSFTRNLDSTEERQQRLGSRLEHPRQKIHGWSGSATFEEEDVVLDDLLDLLVTRYQDGIATERIDIVETIYHEQSGQTRTYVYPDCVFKINHSASGKNDELEKTLDWMSATRQLVS